MSPIYFEKKANLAKHPTLFIHGNLASTKWWRPTLKAWESAGPLGAQSLYFADWRGCGQNPQWPSEQAFTLEDLACDFLALMERENLQTCSLVGHSLGGLIALQMMTMAPRRFNKAVLLDPVGAQGVTFDESMYEAFRQMAQSPQLTQTVILSTIAGAEKLDAKFQQELAEDAFKAVRGIGTSVLEILKSMDLREALKQITTPTLILHGSFDTVLPLADSKDLATILPHAEFRQIETAGHCWNVEDPTAFTATLRQWL